MYEIFYKYYKTFFIETEFFKKGGSYNFNLNITLLLIYIN